ncbi:hypothetical protein F4810DRAFT_430505 [Camillea tinctor]|nr:hypothetical protein F4810DRAFT_430505 [Camillea tinctor]
MASSSIYSDKSGVADGSTPSSASSTGLIPTFSPASGQYLYENECSATSMPTFYLYEIGNINSLSPRELAFDREVGRREPERIGYLEECSRMQDEDERRRRRASAQEEAREAEQRRSLADIVFSHLRQTSEMGVRITSEQRHRIVGWLAQVNDVQVNDVQVNGAQVDGIQVSDVQEEVGDGTNVAGFPDSDPGIYSSLSNSSSSWDSPVHSPSSVEGHYSAQHPHFDSRIAFMEGYAEGIKKGYRKGWKAGWKVGYDDACDFNRSAIETYSDGRRHDNDSEQSSE